MALSIKLSHALAQSIDLRLDIVFTSFFSFLYFSQSFLLTFSCSLTSQEGLVLEQFAVGLPSTPNPFRQNRALLHIKAKSLCVRAEAAVTHGAT